MAIKQSLRRSIPFGAGLLSILVVFTAAVIARGPDEAGTAAGDVVAGEVVYSSGDEQWLPTDGKKPCVAGGLKLKSADELAGSLRVQLYLPDHDAARSSTIEVAWMCTPTTAHILFTSGIKMKVTPTEDPDLVGDWREQQVRDPRHHRLGLVRGRPAKVFDLDGDPVKEEGGSVAWLPDSGPLLLVVTSESHPLSTLQAVAESVAPYPA